NRFCKPVDAKPLPLGVTRLEDGTVLDANEAFTRLMNRTRDEILGQTTVALGVIDPVQRTSIIDRLQKEGVVSDIELELRPRNSEPRNRLLSLVRIQLGGQQRRLRT